MKTLKKLKLELCKEDPALAGLIADEVERLNISESLKTARKAAGMTQEQVALRMHVNRAYVAQLEGKPQNITVATLVKYTAALGGHLSVQIDAARSGRSQMAVAEDPAPYRTKKK